MWAVFILLISTGIAQSYYYSEGSFCLPEGKSSWNALPYPNYAPSNSYSLVLAITMTTGYVTSSVTGYTYLAQAANGCTFAVKESVYDSFACGHNSDRPYWVLSDSRFVNVTSPFGLLSSYILTCNNGEGWPWSKQCCYEIKGFVSNGVFDPQYPPSCDGPIPPSSYVWNSCNRDTNIFQ
jgi:hypothetical protein